MQFKAITFPNLVPTLTVLGLVGTLWASNVFDLIWMMTRGGPGVATTTVPVLMYDTAFYGYNISRATAGAIIFLVILILYSITFIFLNRRQFVSANQTFQDLTR
jgi:ABC-type sugar transport system permease subunit